MNHFLFKIKRAWHRLLNSFVPKETDTTDETKQNIDFSSSAKKRLNERKLPRSLSILYLCLAFFLIFVIWASFSVIEEVTVGSGKVIPSTYVKSLQSLDGGILESLFVKKGQIVKANQVVAKLSVSDAEAEYFATKNHYLNLAATVARLQAEAYNNSTIAFPKVLDPYPEIRKNETRIFEQRQKSLQSRVETLQKSYELIKKQVDINAPLAKKGIVSRVEFLQLQNNLNMTKGSLSEEQNKFHREVLAELSKSSDELSSIQERIQGLSKRITRATIRSPVYGIVQEIHVTTVGGVIKPGGDIMEIVPLEDTLLVEAKISPKDIAFIHPKQLATVRFTAYDYSIYGSLKGFVEYISADTVADDKGNNYYLVHVRTNRNHLGSDSKPLYIIPGMVATVDILTGKKTVANYLLKPIFKAKYEALRER